MKKLFILWMLLLPCFLCAQTDKQAAEILDKIRNEWSNSSGIRIDFEGTENGSLLLKGEKFYLNSGNIQSWFDGKTQWSYVADTDEVNISNPTPEELQAINPYLILKRYQTDFNYIYKGNQTKKGETGHEIVLKPKQSGQPEVIRMFISKSYQPLAIKIEQNGRTVSDIHVISYKANQNWEDGMFRFNQSLYPNAEIIDMR